MIIKKPYAFLIKNFRLIHGLLFVMLVYIFIRLLNIYSFFSDYARTGLYIIQNNLASNYINGLLFLFLVLSTILTFVIYYILSIKDKSNKVYLFLILYNILILIFLIYTNSIFNGLEDKALDTESQRAMRDMSLIVLLPQIIFLFITFARTLGFNLKQFDFKRDLEELEIDVSDNEEVEVTIGSDTYKISRFFRKLLRLTKYFMIENKLFVITCASILAFVLSFSMYKKITIYSQAYTERQNILANSVWYSVKDSYITNSDMRNIVITEGKYYILVNVQIDNRYQNKYYLDREDFRLVVGDQLLFPTVSLVNKFDDLGDVFVPFEILPGENIEKLVVFEIDEDLISKDYILKIKNANRIDEFYKEIIIVPKSLSDIKDMGEYNLPNEIDLSDSILKNTKLTINSYEISNQFKEEYEYTLGGKTDKAIYSIIPESSNNGELNIIKIEASIDIDDDVYTKKYIKTPADLFDNYAIIRYRYQGYYKTVKMHKLNIELNKDNYSYLEVPAEVQKASKIELILIIRGIKYTINLK